MRLSRSLSRCLRGSFVYRLDAVGRMSSPSSASAPPLCRPSPMGQKFDRVVFRLQAAYRMLSRCHHQLYRSHTRFNPKGRIHIGNQPTARNDPPIHLLIFPIRSATTRCTRHNRSRTFNRKTRLPVNQHHPPRLALYSHRHPVDIHPRPYRSPSRRVKARRPFSIH